MKKFLSIIFLSITLILIGTTVSLASYSASNKTVNSEESFSVTVSSSEGLDAYTLKLTGYSGLTYKTCSKNSESGETVICDPDNKVIGYMNATGTTKTLGTFSFVAPKVTEDKKFKITFSVDNETTVTSTITVKAPAVDPEPEPEPEKPTTPEPQAPTTQEPETPATPEPDTPAVQEPETPATSEPDTPAVQEPETPATAEPDTPAVQEPEVPVTPEPETPTTPEPAKKSNNANLSNLGIKPNDFTGFKAANTSYSVSVPNDVTEIEVYANKAESVQTISGTGKKKLSEGSNPFDVIVTAEDGTQKTYRVNVIRLAKEEINNPDVEEPETKVEVALASLQIVSVSLNEAFKPDIYEYTATAGLDAKEVIVSGSANVENALVDIDAPEEYEEGENIITITVREKDGKDKKVYTVKVMKEAAEEDKEEPKEITPTVIGSINNNNNNTSSGGGISKETLIFCAGVAVIALLGIIFAAIRYKKDQSYVEEADELDFVGDISAKEAIIDAAVATSKLTNTTSDAAEEGATPKKGKHF